MKSIAMLPRMLVLALFASSLFAAEPEKLTKLRGSYEAAMTKATAPIQKTYTTELEKLKVELTKSGNLDGALAVDAELKKLSGSSPSATTAGMSIGTSTAKLRLSTFKTKEDFVAWVVGTTWVRSNGATIDITGPETMTMTEPKGTGDYAIQISEVGVIEWRWSGGGGPQRWRSGKT